MPAREDLKVLIVDDSITVRELLKQQLMELGVGSLLEAKTGLDAVEKYENSHPDLVFLDINMPELNGVEALKKIMTLNPKARVIMLSSLGTKEKVTETLKLGARNFLMKPVENESLARIIDEIGRET